MIVTVAGSCNVLNNITKTSVKFEPGFFIFSKMEKVKRYLIKYNNGESVIHWDGVFQPGDMSLCGCDLIGDNSHKDVGNGWKTGVETKKKVNCELCLRIIEHVRSII
jgi:hypothetical protein